MSSVALTTELIEVVKEDFPFHCFVPTGQPIAKHKLFDHFHEYFSQMPKVVFYIIMDDKYGNVKELDGNNLAYMVEFKPELFKLQQ